MTSPLGGIIPVGVGAVSGVAGATTGVPQAQNADGFAAVLASSFDQLQGTQKAADNLAAQAATGDRADADGDDPAQGGGHRQPLPSCRAAW